MTKPQRTYCVILIVAAFLHLISIGEFIILRQHPQVSAGGDVESIRHGYELIIFLMSMYLAVILLILLLQWRGPQRGSVVMTALNVIVLVAFPLGTAAGIYYFVKVNRAPENASP